MRSLPLADPAIDRPIFILGTGRGGTTLFLRMLGEHPDLAWFSNFTHRAKGRMFYPLAALSRVLDLPLIENWLPYEWKVRPKPREANRLYAHLSRGVFNKPRLLTVDDATPEQVRYWRHAVLSHLRWQGKSRFLNKHTGFPRTDYLRKIFPDAYFIHVIRDGRAVANSYVNVDFWDGTLEGCWHWGPMPKQYREEFENFNREPVALAGILWKYLMSLICQAWSRIPENQRLEVNYSELIASPQDTMSRVADFCNLSNSPIFDKRLATIKIRNADNKWTQDLDTNQKNILMQVIGKELKLYGFLE